QRSSALPDVPTTLEAGYKNSDYTFWTGLFAPAKTPRKIVDKLAHETQKALDAPGVRRETRAARHGPDADHARCLRCADQAGNRFNSRLGQSGEPKVQLTGIGRDYGRGSEYHGTGGASRTHANVVDVAPMRRMG